MHREGFEMLKKRNVQDCEVLYDLLIHPDVFPFVRNKPRSLAEYMFMTKKAMDEEEMGRKISRIVLDEWDQPIGTINLFDVKENAGFLATWLGKPFHGKGYNQAAKEAFLEECFFQLGIERIFVKVRYINERSLNAMRKLEYAQEGILFPHIKEEINKKENVYELFVIEKDAFHFYLANKQQNEEDFLMEA